MRWYTCGVWRSGADFGLKLGPLAVCRYVADARPYWSVFVGAFEVFDGLLRELRKRRR